MADSTTLINTFTKSSLTYEGLVTIRSGTAGNFVYKQYDQLMELAINTTPDIVTHYSSSKQQHDVITGKGSVAIISLKDTGDLYQKLADHTSSPDTNLFTDIIQKLNNDMVVVPTVFTGIQKTEDAKFIVEILEGNIVAVSKRRNLDTGDYTDEIIFNINKRTPTVEDTDPVPAPT